MHLAARQILRGHDRRLVLRRNNHFANVFEERLREIGQLLPIRRDRQVRGSDVAPARGQVPENPVAAHRDERHVDRTLLRPQLFVEEGLEQLAGVIGGAPLPSPIDEVVRLAERDEDPEIVAVFQSVRVAIPRLEHLRDHAVGRQVFLWSGLVVGIRLCRGRRSRILRGSLLWRRCRLTPTRHNEQGQREDEQCRSDLGEALAVHGMTGSHIVPPP